MTRRSGLRWIWLALALALLITPAATVARWRQRPAQALPVDFVQYYLGGRMVWLGHPEAVYPTPRPGATINAGFDGGSDRRAFAADEARRLGMDAGGTRFIQPPPSAPLFVPLGMWPLRPAAIAWLVIITLTQISLGGLAAVFCLRCGGGERAAALVLLAAAVAPAGLQAIQVGNLSPIIGLLVGLNLLWLLQGRQAPAGITLAVGVVLKYWNLAIVPIHLARRQHRAAVAAAATGVALFVLSVVTIGLDPYRVFLREIAPTLSWPVARDSLSLYSWALRFCHEKTTLPLTPRLILEAARWLMFVGLAVATYAGRRTIARSDRAAIGMAVAWLAWIFLFAPIFWGHYASVIMPCWGWLAALAARERAWVRVLAIFAIAATSFFTPLFNTILPRLPDPWFMHQAAGLLVMVGLALRELLVERQVEAPTLD